MLIEQTIKFELSGIGPLAVHVLLQLVIFMIKQKFPRNIFEWTISLFTAETLLEAMLPSSPYLEPNYLQNLTPKCKVLKVFWT